MEAAVIENISYNEIEGLNENVGLYYEDDEMVIVSDMRSYSKMRDSSMVIGGERMGWVELMFCLGGSMQWVVNGEQYDGERGVVVILPSHYEDNGLMVSLDAKMVDVNISGQLLSHLLGIDVDKWYKYVYLGGAHKVELRDLDLERIMNYFAFMGEYIELGEYYGGKIVHSLMGVVLYTVLNRIMEGEVVLERVTKSDDISQSKRLFDGFLNCLNHSKPKRHPIGYYASRLSVTPKYLSNVCVKYSGKTAAQWIQESVREEVCYYLKRTLMSIKDVAHTTGFDNESFFGKYVKHHLGCTPREYRRKHIEF